MTIVGVRKHQQIFIPIIVFSISKQNISLLSLAYEGREYSHKLLCIH